MAAEQSPEDEALRNIDGMLRAIDLLNEKFEQLGEMPEVFQDKALFWAELAEIYQSEGWEKAEEWLERGRES